jgi:NAD(P)-dependent dehydrogenase (short-subunit alcohol dehydrogenase family)
MDPFSVAGRRVLVTGASQGIGALLAEGFAAAGASVILTGRDKDALEERSAALGATALLGDLSTEAGCRALADAVDGLDPGGLHVLVNNAGRASLAPFEQFDEAAWEDALSVNVKGTSHLTRFLLPALRSTASPDDPARVINIGSIAGERVGDLDNFGYTTSKAALHHLTRHLARKLAPDVTVNAIAPGPFASRMTARFIDDMARHVPLGRVGRRDDIASAAIYLASPAGSWVTGSILTIDGGVSLT